MWAGETSVALFALLPGWADESDQAWVTLLGKAGVRAPTLGGSCSALILW